MLVNSSAQPRPVVALVMGDPAGISPELPAELLVLAESSGRRDPLCCRVGPSCWARMGCEAAAKAGTSPASA